MESKCLETQPFFPMLLPQQWCRHTSQRGQRGKSPVCSVLFPRLLPAVQSAGLATVLVGYVTGLANALQQPAAAGFCRADFFDVSYISLWMAPTCWSWHKACSRSSPLKVITPTQPDLDHSGSISFLVCVSLFFFIWRNA